jgi:hypothetical protein
MSTDPVVSSIQYRKKPENILNDIMFTLDFKNTDKLAIPLGAVLSADVGVDYLKTEELRAEIFENFKTYGGSTFYVARSMTMAIDCSYLPLEHINRIKILKNIMAIRMKSVQFDDDGMCRTYLDSFAYFPQDYFNGAENIYQTIENGDGDLILLKVDESCDYQKNRKI